MNDIERLERIYGAAGRELRRILSLEPGVARVRAREIVKVLNMAVDKWANDAIPRAYTKAARTARTSLEILGKKPRRRTFVDRGRILRDNLMVVLIRANNSIPAVVDEYLAATALVIRTVETAQLQEFTYSDSEEKILRMARKAVAKQESRKTLENQLRSYLIKQIEDDGFLKINDRNYNMKKYAEMVSRTALREAQTEATLDLCEQYDNDLVQWSDHGTVCEICIEFEGKIYSISGKSLEYPMLEREPPAHPNCEHSLLPTSDIAIEVMGRRDLGGRAGYL